jgi:hypothetical protein
MKVDEKFALFEIPGNPLEAPACATASQPDVPGHGAVTERAEEVTTSLRPAILRACPAER